jgi:predicted phage tail protein
MNTIRVYGPLAEFLGRRVFEAVVDTAIEALRFLNANFPGLRQHLANQRYCIAVGDHLLSADELSHPIGRQELRIIPAFSGELEAGLGLLIDGLSTAANTLAQAAPILLGIGLSVGLSYLSSQLQSKTPQVGVSASSSTQNDPRSNFSFSGVQNTARAGVPVPIVYGEVIVGSVVVSAGIDTVQVKA